MRRCSKLNIRFRLQRVHDNGIMRTPTQDGDEKSFESTEVSAYKATESRDEVQKISERKPTQKHRNEQEVTNKTRNQKCRGRTKSQESLR